MNSETYVSSDGRYLGTFTGLPGPEGGKLVPTPPSDGRQIWNGTAWIWPEKNAAERRESIAARRYQAEVAGITFSGMPLATDRDSQGLINGAALSAYTDPSYVCRWKTSAGYVTLDAATLKAVAKAIRDHVQACFDREDELTQAVEDGTYTDAMLEEGWPG